MFTLVEHAFEHDRKLSVIRNWNSFGTVGKAVTPGCCLIGLRLEGRGNKVPDLLGLDPGKRDAVPEVRSFWLLFSVRHGGPDAGGRFAGHGVISAGARLESGSGSSPSRRIYVPCEEGAASLGMPRRSRGDLLPSLSALDRQVRDGDFPLSLVLSVGNGCRKWLWMFLQSP